MAGRTIRVMIADDHLMVRKGLRLMLEEEGEGVELVGDAANGREAVALLEQLQPDVVLMDIRMPQMDGIAALKQIQTSWPGVAVILLTTYNEDDLILKGLQAGACGYLLKDTPVKTLLSAIQTAARGEMLIQPEIMARVLAYTHQAVRDNQASALETPVPRLPGKHGAHKARA
jgi:NarL family two-component system response regulator YdfI